MPRFAANLTMMFGEVPFLDRFALAAKAGFKAVEFLFPYDHPAAEVKRRLDDNGLALALHNMPPGDWAAGERGIGCLPDRTGEFREGVARAVEYASALGSPLLHAMAGLRPAGVPEDRLRATYVANVAYAAAETAKAGIRLVMEPINPRDIPGYYLNTTRQALAFIDEIGSDNLFVQYDIYHAQNVEGDLARTIETHLARIAHMQLADNPGRNEPGTGEINYEFLFRKIDALGYSGWIGCEYRPLGETMAGLGWVKPYL